MEISIVKILYSFLNWCRLRLSLLLIIFVYISLFFYFINRGLNYIDEGYILQGVQRIFNGQKPYKDFDTQVTPGTFYLQYILMKIFGKEIIIGRVWVMLEGILILIILYYLGQIYLSFPFSLLPSVLYIFWGPIHHPLPFYSYDSLFFSILSFFFLIKNMRIYSLVAGFFAFISFFFKQNTGLASLIIGNLIIFSNKSNKKSNLIFYWSGVLLGIILSIYLFISQDILYPFLKTIFIIPFKAIFLKNAPISYIGFNKFPLPGGKGKIFWFSFFSIIIGFYMKKRKEKKFKISNKYLFYLILFACMGIGIFQLLKEEQNTFIFRTTNSFIKSFLTTFPLIYLFFSFFCSENVNYRKNLLPIFLYNLIYIPFGLLMGEDFIHFLYILPVSLIGFVIVVESIDFEKKFFWLIIIFISFWGLVNAVQNTSQRFAYGPIYRQNELLLTDFSKKIRVEKLIKEDYEFIVNFVKNNTSIDENIFVWGTDPILNFLFNRPSPSKYILFAFTDHNFENDTISQLKTKNVRYIIERISNPYNPFFKDLKKFAQICKFIEKNYKIKYNLNCFNILEKK